MTPLSKSRVTEESLLCKFSRFNAVVGWPACGDSPPVQGDPVSEAASWLDVYDITRFRQLNRPHIAFDSSDLEQRVSDARNSCMASVVSDAYSTLDLLTTVAEGKDSLTLVRGLLSSAINPLRTIRSVLKGAKSPQAYADSWLQFRYGIMPLIYSVQDAIQLIEDRGYTFSSHKSGRKVYADYNPGSVPDETCSFSTLKGLIFIRCTGKARFTSGDVHAFNNLTFNPAITAWELVPYSFVVDWFINVGDWLTAQSFEMMDFASQREFCISEKRDLVEEHFIRDKYSHYKEVVYENDPYGRSGTISWGPYSHDLTKLAYRKSTSSYNRSLFKPTDIRIDAGFDMNIKRWLDSFALSLRPLTKGLRNLRRP